MNKQTTRLLWAIIVFIWLMTCLLVTVIVGLRLRNARNNTGAQIEPISIPTASPTPIIDVAALEERMRDGSDRTLVLAYAIDKSAVPTVSFNELTYKLTIGNSANVQLSSATGNIPFVQNGDTIQFTTDADTFTLTFPSPALISDLGQLNITPLKHDKAWAWSHGFDDNVFLNKSIEAFEAHGYRGTLFLILRDVWEDREEDWTLDEPQLKQLLANGWSVGNHTWAHECNGNFDYQASIATAYDRLFQIISRSQRPDYRLISFAAPCFDKKYHPLILQHRDQQTSQVLFNESGENYLLRVDKGATESVWGEGKTAVPFTFDLPIGRDGNADNGTDVILAHFDWVSRNTTASQHLWYNTLVHGQNEGTINAILDHLDSNYKEEVWVAPSDEIYSYLLLRDKVRILATSQ